MGEVIVAHTGPVLVVMKPHCPDPVVPHTIKPLSWRVCLFGVICMRCAWLVKQRDPVPDIFTERCMCSEDIVLGGHYNDEQVQWERKQFDSD